MVRRLFCLASDVNNVDPDLVRRVQSAGKRVHVWTINQEDDLKRMIDLSVEAMITDNPVKALSLLERNT